MPLLAIVLTGYARAETKDSTLEIQDRLTSPPADAFSIVLIPDTQAYQGAQTKSQPDSTAPVTNPIFAAHTQWISENLERQRIVFVSHVGDIVDKNVPAQWEVARQCMDKLHGRVPYGISVGNHDMTSQGDATLFQTYFPKSRFADFEWYGGAYAGSALGPQVSGNNANSFQLFSAGGMDFIFLHLECNAPDDVLDWANHILKKHANRRALITSHMGWGPAEKPTKTEEYITGAKGRMRWSKIHGERGNSPQQMWEKCYRKHENLIAVFSGDQSRTRTFHAATAGEHGNIIHEFLQDYGRGELRLYRFVPQEDRIDVITFEPRTEKLCPGIQLVPDRTDHQFSIDYSMSPVDTR
ncbi:MAG: metallophosphoesterase [Planctomycetales bacterium]|nr:metallophosphoesterase [Planctomycetales bacterium]